MIGLIIGVVIYSTGYVLSYILFRRLWSQNDLQWTKGDRWTALSYSIVSWVMVFALVMTFIENRRADRGTDDKPAKW